MTLPKQGPCDTALVWGASFIARTPPVEAHRSVIYSFQFRSSFRATPRPASHSGVHAVVTDNLVKLIVV